MRVWVQIAIGAALVGFICLSDPSFAQQKTVKACQAEWRANKADNQAQGITEKVYVEQCRAAGASAQPTVPTGSPASRSQTITTAAPARKTVRACQEEWRANRADNQAKGITERAYVEQCRGGGAAAQPVPSSAAPPAPSTSRAPSGAPAPTPQKTVKACQDEWRANRDAYRAAKITERSYVEKCRAGEAVALPNAPAGTPSSTTATPAPSQSAPTESQTAPAPAPTRARPAPSAPTTPGQATAPTGADQFQTEAQAKSHCPADLVVWVNLTSKIYHFAGYKSYGMTKRGAYMCEQEATAQGFRPSKTEARPST